LCCREKHGDYFGIGVAGYPEAHPDFIVDDEEQMKKNYWDSLAYLKEKVRGCVTLLYGYMHMSCFETSQRFLCHNVLLRVTLIGVYGGRCYVVWLSTSCRPRIP
jgi:hypothetical protein